MVNENGNCFKRNNVSATGKRNREGGRERRQRDTHGQGISGIINSVLSAVC